MPYVRRFYYLPRDNAPKDTDVLAPCESLWKFEGTSLHSNHDECKANSARPKSFQDLPNEEQVKQLRYKKILGMLNKMTPKKFQKLILQIGPESMDVTYVKMLAEIIFSKALVDEMYVNLYAKLCEEVTSTLPTESLDCFKQVLIDLCETGFNQLLDLTDNDIGSIHEDKRYTFKRRLMTLMRFIGEMSCISIPFFDRTYNWHLTEQLIDKGDELHLEAVYFLLFTISLRSTDNAWTKRIERAVGRISYGCEPMGKGEVRSEIKFKFQALSDLRRGCLQQSYCAEWNRATDQDIIFNFHFISGSFPECSNKSSKEIVEILIKSTGFFNIKTWKVTDIVNSDSFAHIIFVIDNQSFVWLNNRNFSVSFQSINICFKLLDSYIPLKSPSIKNTRLNESQDSNSSEIDDSSSESDSDEDRDDQSGGDSSDSDSNCTTYGSAVSDKDMLDVLSKFGLTVKNGCVKKAELSESDETEDSSDIDESSTDEDNLYENSTTEVENDANFDNNLLSDRLEKSQIQINPTVKTNEIKKILIKQEMSIKTAFITDEAAKNSHVTAKKTEESKQIENLQENSVKHLAKTNISANEIDKNCINVLIKPGSLNNSRTAFLNQFDEIIELKQNVKKNESVPVIATEKLATALSSKMKKSTQSIPTEKLVMTSSSNDCKIEKSSSFSLPKKIENSATTMNSCFSDNQRKSFCSQVKGKKIVLPEIPSHKFAFSGNFKGLFRLKNAELLLLLDKHNRNAQINKWKIVDRACISDNEAQITFTAPRSIISDLKKINYTVNFESNDVFLNPVDFPWDKDVEKITKSVADSSDFDHFEISITPMNFPNDLFSDETLTLLEGHITNKKEEFLRNQLSWKNGLETELKFDAICVMKGWLLILCSNRETLNWILFLHFSSTYVKHVGVNISRINVSGYFPFSINDNQLLQKISKENNWVKDWNIVKREERALGALITFSIDAKSAHHLLKNKHVINVTKSIQYKVELIWEDLIRVIKSPEMSIGKLSSGDSLDNSDKVLFEGEFIYSCRFDTKSIFNSLVEGNKNVDFTTWNVVRRTDLNDSSVRLTFSANRKFLKCLDRINYNLFFNAQVIPLTLSNNQKWKDILNFDDESSLPSVKKVDEQQGFKYKIDERLFKKSEDKYSDYKPTKVNDRVTFQAVFPKSVKYSTKDILSILSQCNKNLNLSSWSSVARNNLNNDVRLTLCADRDEMKCLKQFDFSLFYNADIIKLSPISDKSWKDELECNYIQSVNVPDQNNKSNDIVFEGVFPKCKTFLNENFLQKLIKSNRKLGMEKWKLIDKDCQKQHVYVLFSADIDTLQMLKQAKYKAYYGDIKILFHPADFDGWDEAFDKCISDQNVARATTHMNQIPDVSLESTSSNVSRELLVPNNVSKVSSIKSVSRESTSSNVSRESSVSNNVSKVPSIKSVSRESQSSNVSSQSITTEQLNKTRRVTQNSNLPDVVQNAKPLVILFTGEFPKSSHLKNKTIKNTLLKLNPKLKSSEWTIMLRQGKRLLAIITFSADYKLIKPLIEANFKLCYNNTDVYVKPFNNKSWDGIVNIVDVQQYNECVKSQIELISKNMSASLAHIGNLKKSLIQMSNKKEPLLQSGNPNESLLQSSKKNDSQLQNFNSQLKDQKESQAAYKKETESQNKAAETKLAQFQVVLPDSCDMKNKEIYNCLLNCNKKLGVAKWTLVERQNVKKSARLIFKADCNCVRLLKDYQYKISYQKNQLLVKPMNKTWDEWERILNPSLKFKIDSEYEKSSSSTNGKKASDESYDYGTAYPIHLNDSLPSSSYSAPNNATYHSKTSPIPLNESFPSISSNYRSSSNDPLPFISRASTCKSIANNSLPFSFHDATYKNVSNNSAPPTDVVYENVDNFPAPSASFSSPYRLMNDLKHSSSNLVITNKNVDNKSFSNSIPNLIGYKVAILPANFPSVLFTEEQFKRIETVLNEYIYYEKVSNKLEFIPKLNSIKKFGGWMLILCYDNLTADWLVNLELEPWVKAKLTVVRED